MAISSSATGLRPGVCTSTTRPTNPYNGQLIYETDTRKVYIYNGTSWVEQPTAGMVDAKGDLLVGTAADTAARLVVGVNDTVLVADSAASTGIKWAALSAIGGAWTDYSPTLSQNGTVTRTVDYAKYVQIQKTVIASIYITATGTGSAGSPVAVSLPVTAQTSSTAMIGSGFIFDASATNLYTVTAQMGSTTSMWFYADQTGTGARWGIAPSIALGNNDQIGISFMYQAA